MWTAGIWASASIWNQLVAPSILTTLVQPHLPLPKQHVKSARFGSKGFTHLLSNRDKEDLITGTKLFYHNW